LIALGVKEGDEVIVPSHTFFATWLAVIKAGAIPVAADINNETYLIDPGSVEKCISHKTRAVIPVHLYGLPADVDAIRAVCRGRGIYVIEDAAQAHGAEYKGLPIGALSDITAWSFYPGKNLGAFGDGGAVTSNNADLVNRVRTLSNYGSSKKYTHDYIGSNSRMDPIQAAILLVKLNHLPEWNDLRFKFALEYNNELAQLKPFGDNKYSLTLPVIEDSIRRSACHLYVVRTKCRDELQKRLSDGGIETLIHYPIPPHKQPAMTGLRYIIKDEIAYRVESLSKEILSLPIGPHLLSTAPVISALSAHK
jgi:dTDP-4-amino-4,6-dideoxygalactose transaminase